MDLSPTQMRQVAEQMADYLAKGAVALGQLETLQVTLDGLQAKIATAKAEQERQDRLTAQAQERRRGAVEDTTRTVAAEKARVLQELERAKEELALTKKARLDEQALRQAAETAWQERRRAAERAHEQALEAQRQDLADAARQASADLDAALAERREEALALEGRRQALEASIGLLREEQQTLAARLQAALR